MKSYLFRNIIVILILVTLTHQREDNERREPKSPDVLTVEKEVEFFLIQLKNFRKNFLISESAQKQYLKKIKVESLLSAQCLIDVMNVLEGISEGKMWALHIVDSFGKRYFPSFSGTYADYGDFDQCTDVSLPGKFKGKYCLLKVFIGSGIFDPSLKYPFYLKPSTQNLSLTFTEYMRRELSSNGMFYSESAICVPSSCSISDITRFLDEVSVTLPKDVTLFISDCSTKEKLQFNFSQMIITSFIVMIVFLELLATAFHIRLRSLYKEDIFDSSISKDMKTILCFSFYTNTIRLFKTNYNSDSIKIFHGMKFITLIWVIFGHIHMFGNEILGRISYAYEHNGEFFFQIVSNAFVSVETFYFISGFLVIYSNIKANNPQINIFYYALYRYVRLIPPVVFILCCVLLTPDFYTGPFWKQYVINDLVGTCSESWWRNLLCINNFSYSNHQCFPWTWYIAVDMQLHLATYFLFLLTRRSLEKMMKLVKVAIVASVIFLAAIHIYYKLPPSPTLTNININHIRAYLGLQHARTYNHVTPYCFGMLLGYMVAMKKKIIHLTPVKKLFGWSLSYIFAVVAVFSTYLWNSGRTATLIESVLYGSIHRLLWSLMLTWVTYVCLNGDGGVVTSILSWNYFVPLSRLTFMAFLIHPPVILLTFGQFKHQGWFIETKFPVYMWIGVVSVSYILAFVFSLICESPLIALQSLLISEKFRKKEILENKENCSKQ